MPGAAAQNASKRIAKYKSEDMVSNRRKPEAKSKATIVKEKRTTNNKTLRNAGGVAKNKHPNAMTPSERKKYKGKTLTEIIKGGIKKITGGGKAKAAVEKMGPKIVPKKKPLSPSQKKKDAAIMKAETARRTKSKNKRSSAPIMKAESASRKRAKADMPTGRSSAASGAFKKKEAAKRKKYVQGKVKSGPSGKR
tara:strand:- start:496 stop:1077 length:582 start_codon:yes stop_codon:yes gene_type:complete